ncbi:septum formation protein Maf [Flavobacterium branchiophilum NBRC 15030 = ATCC 35035]|uniref:dTTP/UTP pyrophosphatase n=1 Tax=Flavobacterium branchiophilum TaxID=55197 RepID=A0A543G7Y9_9FLAO|nr:Maf family nucleotide pyrophosphatase [Flavobacterium branchiophilum]OXA76941.1 septum formation protein Maf [Flavobacterium branchiophilum NBRC 15030 = ATCC 35035]TQM42200.1 septum formation protein [Flavobacterium branchiophilum]GEM54505.1 Maf-like protein [Flavobacterium branchiophilum NBRC 15030 = ATCC 35035]
MLKEKLSKYNIILASGSPRRQQFFKELDIHFTIKVKAIDEIYPSELKAAAITNYLCKLKAKAYENELEVNDIVITSDTIVWLNGEALEKPKNAEEAMTMLQKLSNQTHEVITSVCFKTCQSEIVIEDKTYVTFAQLNKEMLTYYLQNYKPYDKAGSYGIQEWIGLVGITKIEGSYCNVVGLPTHKVFDYFYHLD